MLRLKRAWRAVGGASLHVMEKPPPSAHAGRARVPPAVPHDAKSPSGFSPKQGCLSMARTPVRDCWV